MLHVPLHCLTILLLSSVAFAGERPNIILVMADDMGWGQTGYYNHPVLKTPHLDDMAAHGLRFDRFYAGAPNCSPTRATVLTGRTNDRTGVLNHGVPLRPQEQTIAKALKQAGYATGHFGKWHLNGMRGPGAPIFADDIRSPGNFGFETWLSVTNFFDRDPIMSRNGEFEEFKGDSSEIIVDEAIQFITQQVENDKPFLSVIWYGTPHSPFLASNEDKAAFANLDQASQNHYGELVAMDRSIGTLRKSLKDLNVADNTFLCFCSDNGGLNGIKPSTVGGLRGFKNTMYEGGLRVPCVMEWPGGITTPRVTNLPACTMDLFPTIVDIVGLPKSSMLKTIDGQSLQPLFVHKGKENKNTFERESAMFFRHTGRAALIDGDYKLITSKIGSDQYELYDLSKDEKEQHNLIKEQPQVASKLIALMQAKNDSVNTSLTTGTDYPEAEIIPADPGPSTWTALEKYQPFIKQHGDRWEFRKYTKRKNN